MRKTKQRIALGLVLACGAYSCQKQEDGKIAATSSSAKASASSSLSTALAPRTAASAEVRAVEPSRLPKLLPPNVRIDETAAIRGKALLRNKRFRANFVANGRAALVEAGVTGEQASTDTAARPSAREIDGILQDQAFASERDALLKQTRETDRRKDCLPGDDGCPLPPDDPDPPPPRPVRSTIATFKVEKRSCGILPEGAKDNDRYIIPLPNGKIDYVGVQISSTAGVFGGGAYVGDQTNTRVVVVKDEKTGELKNGSVAVNVRWWFNGWSAVTYTLEVYALSKNQLASTRSVPLLTAPHCPANKGALEALQKVNCFLITVGGDLDGNFNASNVGVGVSISCPNPPQPGPIVDWSCPASGRAGEYVCLPDWTSVARVLGF